jgi:predicted nuclease of predicted toxin-antitoxin system
VKFKLDENIGSDLSREIAKVGHDMATVSAQSISGCEDQVLYDVCRAEQRILVTLDMDFANPLRFPPEATAGIIVLRPPRPLLTLLRAALTSVLGRIETGTESIAGRLWIVEPTSIRIYEPSEPPES